MVAVDGGRIMEHLRNQFIRFFLCFFLVGRECKFFNSLYCSRCIRTKFGRPKSVECRVNECLEDRLE